MHDVEVVAEPLEHRDLIVELRPPRARQAAAHWAFVGARSVGSTEPRSPQISSSVSPTRCAERMNASRRRTYRG